MLDELRRRHRDEVAQRLREARAYGDGSSNDEYHAIREEQLVLEARIALLEATIARAVVTDSNQLDDDVAGIGSTVSIEDLASGRSSRHRLASAHAAGSGCISAASPLGQPLIGVRPGTVVTADLPNGNSRSVRLTALEIQDPANDGA